eukprot:965055_1
MDRPVSELTRLVVDNDYKSRINFDFNSFKHGDMVYFALKTYHEYISKWEVQAVRRTRSDNITKPKEEGDEDDDLRTDSKHDETENEDDDIAKEPTDQKQSGPNSNNSKTDQTYDNNIMDQIQSTSASNSFADYSQRQREARREDFKYNDPDPNKPETYTFDINMRQYKNTKNQNTSTPMTTTNDDAASDAFSTIIGQEHVNIERNTKGLPS